MLSGAARGANYILHYKTRLWLINLFHLTGDVLELYCVLKENIG